MPRACVFCRCGGPFTGEHLLPEWTAKLIGVKRVRVTRTAPGTRVTLGERVGTFGQKVKSVCGGCNNGWMHDLEQLAIPILSPIIRARGIVPLTADEQLVIAAWVWKIAVLHEFFSKARYFTTAERTCLMDGDSPPDDHVWIWVAAHVRGRDANIKGGAASFTSPDGHRTMGFQMSMSLKHFAAQILCIRPPDARDFRATVNQDFSDAEILIWPTTADRVVWPPRLSLNGAGFEQWHSRFNARRPLR